MVWGVYAAGGMAWEVSKVHKIILAGFITATLAGCASLDSSSTSDRWSNDTPRYDPLGNVRKWGGPNHPPYEDPSTLRQLSMTVVHDMAMSTAASPKNEQQTIETALKQVRTLLKDPEFKSVTVVKYQEGRVVCGLVKPKTSHGENVGFKPFVAGVDDALLYAIDPENPALADAANAGINDACGTLK
jgi:hypothetical protein